MAQDQQVYKKHDSFVEVRHKENLEDALPRIQNLYGLLDGMELQPYRKKILKNACEEILGKSVPKDGQARFNLHSYTIAEMNRLQDSELPRYLYYRYRYEMFPQRFKVDDFPPCLQIEPTSVCNYRCVFCYQTDKEFTKKSSGMMGMMSLNLFKSIIDQAEGQCEAISLASRGEPLICPDIEPMLEYAEGKFLGLKLNTNAWFLDEKLSHAILQAGVNTLVFSAEAATEPAYSNLRVGGKLDRVYENVKLFHKIRAKHYPRSRTITRVSGIHFPGADELNEMEKFWGEWVDQVSFVAYNPWENTYERPIHDLEEPCSDLWRRLFVWWDGIANPCDSDFKSQLSPGNAKDMSLSALWRSEAYENLRGNHLKKSRTQCSPCNRCAVV